MRTPIVIGLAWLSAGAALAQGSYDKAWEVMAQMRFIERNCPQYRLHIEDRNVEKVYGAAAGSARVTERLAEAETAADRDPSVKAAMCLMIAQNLTGPAVYVKRR